MGIKKFETLSSQSRESIAAHADFLDAMPIVAYVADSNGRMSYLSRGWETFSGHSAAKLIEYGFETVIHPLDVRAANAVWSDARQRGAPYADEFRIRLSDDSYRYVSSRAEPMRDFASEIVAWAGTLSDVDDRRRAELELEAHARFIDRLMEASEDCIKVLDLDAKLVSMNERGKELLQIGDFGAVQGTNWLDFWQGADRVAAVAAVEAAVRAGRGRFTGTFAVGGVAKTWDVTVTPILDARGIAERLLVVTRDITEIVEGNRARALAETRYRLLDESLPVVTWTALPDGALDFISSPLHSLFGPATDRLGVSWLDFVHLDDLVQIQAQWNRSIETGSPYDVRMRLQGVDGSYRWYLCRATAHRDQYGEISSWIGITVDIDDQQREYERERRISIALQQASLPRELPMLANFYLSADYRPGNSEATIGGDWYDAFLLRDGRVALTIGDVLGKGLDAAVTMGKVRQAIRAAGSILPDPSAMLDAADSAIRDAGEGEVYATALVGVYDPETLVFTFSSAGHPGPMVRRPDGTIAEFDQPSLLLGLRTKADAIVSRIELTPGTTLVFYTDGLTESTREIEVGLRRVRSALGQRRVTDSKNPARILVDVVLDGAPLTDDIAVMIAEIGPSERFIDGGFRSSEHAYLLGDILS